MPDRRTLRPHKALTPPPSQSISTRPRRAVSGPHVTVDRDTSESSEDSRRALRLTVKMPSSKLREATSAGSRPPSRQAALISREGIGSAEIVSGPRATRNAKKSYVMESDTDEEDEDEDDEDEIEASADPSEDDEEEIDERQDTLPEEVEGRGEEEEESEEDEDVDADADADGDVDMDDDADDGMPLGAPPLMLKVNGPAPRSAPKPTVTVTPAQDTKMKSMEAREMETNDDDEELSELQSEEEDEEPDAEGEEDAEGDEEDVDEMDDVDGARGSDAGSRGSTPDVSKMTKRQRSRLDQVMGSDFLQLPMGTSFDTKSLKCIP